MRKMRTGSWVVLGALLASATGACGDSDKKPTCETGAEGCVCFSNNTCQDGLSCFSNLCVDPNAPSGGKGSGTGGSTSASGGEDNTEGGESPGQGGKSGTTGGKSGATGGKSGTTGGNGNGTGGTLNNGPTPVSLHGKLSVNGSQLLDESGASVKLEGMSSMWLNWDPTGYAESREGLAYMRDNWNLRIFRAAMGIDAEGAYLEDPEKAKEQVNRIVQNAIDLGVYVIIDWHDHEALAHQAQAEAFFDEMSKKWGGYPNVLYEVFNEPLAVNWASQLKPYHQTLISTIRANDPDNIIILGTPNWDQDVDVAAASPVSGSNLMYTLHFYACTHGASFRAKAQSASSRGLPLFVTEWGSTHADGGVDGRVCEAETRAWHDWLDQTNISWTAWKLDGCTDSTCMFKDRLVPVDGDWTSEQLNGHAYIVIDEMMNGPTTTGGATGTGGSSSTGGKASTGGAGPGGAGGTGGTGVDPFPPDPAGCALVSTCPTCCETTGVFALDSLSMDATSLYVTSFSASATAASASFAFTGSNQIGAIFFKLKSSIDITALGLNATSSGGELEVAVVNGGGAHGCMYSVIANELYFIDCWGDGAGPAGSYPVDQIEFRVRSVGSGNATLSVADVNYADL